MDKIWYRNPSKSEVIRRCGGDEKPEWPRRIDKSRTLKIKINKFADMMQRLICSDKTIKMWCKLNMRALYSWVHVWLLQNILHERNMQTSKHIMSALLYRWSYLHSLILWFPAKQIVLGVLDLLVEAVLVLTLFKKGAYFT